MNLVGREGECHVFQIEHKSEYQKIQNKFWDAVDSMAPENLMVQYTNQPVCSYSTF